MISLDLVVPPAVEPISIAEMMAYLRIGPELDGSYPDAPIVSGLIAAARQTIESLSNRALINQTWSLTLDGFPGGAGYYSRAARLSGDPFLFMGTNYAGEIRLPKAPFRSLVRIGYLDPSSAAVVISPNLYRVIGGTDSTPRIVLTSNNVWPVTYSGPGSVMIDYVVGFGPDASTVPANLKYAVIGLVAHWFYPPEGEAPKIPTFVNALLDGSDYGGGIG